MKKSYHFSESRTAFPKVVGLFGENSYLVAVLAVLLVVSAVANSEIAVARIKRSLFPAKRSPFFGETAVLAARLATPVVVSAPVESL